jgi:CDP-diacylglycerol--glycerol-3-phosphate 3-phosphatidyltransferase
MKKHRTNWANVLTWSRLALIIPITIAAYLGAKWFVLWLFVIAMLTDFFDGKVARWTGTASEADAKLDSRVDSLMLPFFIYWFYALFPQVIADFKFWLIIFVSLFIVGLSLTYWKIGTVTGAHLWSGKLSAVGAFLVLPGSILFSYNKVFILIVLAIAIIASVEEILFFALGGKNLDARFFWEK